MITRRTVAKTLAATPFAAAALLHLDADPGRIALAQEGPVRIGSKNFTEQLILGEMYALLLENAGIRSNTGSLNLGGTEVAQAALLAGEIDLYPEYTGTALTLVLGIPIESVAAGTPVAGAATPVDQVASIDQGSTTSSPRSTWSSSTWSGSTSRRSTTRRPWRSSAPSPKSAASPPSASWPRSPAS